MTNNKLVDELKDFINESYPGLTWQTFETDFATTHQCISPDNIFEIFCEYHNDDLISDQKITLHHHKKDKTICYEYINSDTIKIDVLRDTRPL